MPSLYCEPYRGGPLWATTAFKSSPLSSSAVKTIDFWHPSNCAKWAMTCSSIRAATPHRPVQNGQVPVLIITSTDQTIAKPLGFSAAVKQAIAQAEQGHIVILGVTPDKPETGYFYILTDQSSSAPQGSVIEQIRILLDIGPLKSKRCLTPSVEPSKNWLGCQRSLLRKCAELVACDLAQAKQHAIFKANEYAVNVSVE
jgi:hypothetical protein